MRSRSVHPLLPEPQGVAGRQVVHSPRGTIKIDEMGEIVMSFGSRISPRKGIVFFLAALLSVIFIIGFIKHNKSSPPEVAASRYREGNKKGGGLDNDLSELLVMVKKDKRQRKKDKAQPPQQSNIALDREDEISTTELKQDARAVNGGPTESEYYEETQAPMAHNADALDPALANYLFGTKNGHFASTCGAASSLDNAEKLIAQSSAVEPRVRFKNIFTTPLPLQEVVSQSSRSLRHFIPHGDGRKGDDDDKSHDYDRVDDAYPIFDSNIIMRLYKSIPPSSEDAGRAAEDLDNKAHHQSSFFDLMDEGMYTLHPMRVGLQDYLQNDGKGIEGRVAPDKGGRLLRGGPKGYWSRDRPFLRELLMRYQSFHHEGIRRLRIKMGQRPDRDEQDPALMSASDLTDSDYQQFVVVRPVGQLCNRLVAITSAFIFSVLTRRILLIDDGDFYCASDDLFLEPGFEWILRQSMADVRDWHMPSSSGGVNVKANNYPQNSRSVVQGHSIVNQGILAPFGVKQRKGPTYGRKLPSSSPSAAGSGRMLNPQYVIMEAFGSELRTYTIQNPEGGVWSETEPLLCSEDYRKTFGDGGDSKSRRASVVAFTVNQYLVPYFYRNQHYHAAMREIFGDINVKSSAAYDTSANIWSDQDDIFSPIAHFLFRPLPSLIEQRDTYIKEHFFDREVDKEEGDLQSSYVVGLQVRSGGDFTDHFMSEEDWHLYRDCGLQTSPPDVALPQYEHIETRARSVAFVPNTLGRRSGKNGRRFKFFVATDTEKGRQAASHYLKNFPTVAKIGNNNAHIIAHDSSKEIPVLFGPDKFKLSNNPEGVQAALLDLLLLAACDDRVQTAWSSFGYFSSGISGVNGNIIVNRAPFVDDAATTLDNNGAVNDDESRCWADCVGAQRLSLLHPQTLARHAVGRIVANSNEGRNPLLLRREVPQGSNSKENMPPPRAHSSASSENYKVVLNHFREHNQTVLISEEGVVLNAPLDAAPTVHSFGVVIPTTDKSGGGLSNTRASEQRFMGIMHKSDKRVQCVRAPTKEPCFHKFESWGASQTSCYDWQLMTYPEMLRRGRYC